MLTREQMLLGAAAVLVAGVTGGAIVASAVRSEDRATPPRAAKLALLDRSGPEQTGSNTPRSALVKLWSSAQWGDVPAILRLQDAVVRRAMGDAVIAGIYEHQRNWMATMRPRIVATEVDASVATVRYRLQGDAQTAPPHSAIMRRCGRSWCMRYDTFVEDAIPFYAAAVRGSEASLSRADRLAGAEMAASYRAQVARLAPLPRSTTTGNRARRAETTPSTSDARGSSG